MSVSLAPGILRLSGFFHLLEGAAGWGEREGEEEGRVEVTRKTAGAKAGSILALSVGGSREINPVQTGPTLEPARG